jgi:hypothetical protein
MDLIYDVINEIISFVENSVIFFKVFEVEVLSHFIRFSLKVSITKKKIQ